MSKHNDKINVAIIDNLEVSKNTKLLCRSISLGEKYTHIKTLIRHLA